ncbi:MAG: hypothetical protein JJU22_14710 [Gammaproteobacteria bacterium]|nr:hypothetical protein [Gammaproteobacteria bacterium]
MDHDPNFKNLILDYPRQALELFAAAHAAGLDAGAVVTPVRQEQLQAHLGGRYRELDVPLLVTWSNGNRDAIVFVLEEETDPRRFSVRRLAHYCLDLTELLETDRLVPVVIFLRAGAFPRELVLGHDGEDFLSFHYLAYALASVPARDHLESGNIVARLNLPNMAHRREERVEVYGFAMRGLRQLEPSSVRRRKYIDFIDIYAGLDDTERARWQTEFAEEAEEMTRLSERLLTEGRQEGVEEVRQQLLARLTGQLTRRFGALPDSVSARIEAADTDTLLGWLERAALADSLRDVFD